jgi:predicted ATPase
MHVLAGVHTAGKTSLGLRLQEIGYDFFPEVAMESIAGLSPWELGPSFDESVIAEELARDSKLRMHRQPLFVETWHIGNLAYARVRNPSVALKYEARVRAHVSEFSPLVYFLDLKVDLLRERTAYFTHESDRTKAVSFYSHVRREFFETFGLLHVSPIIVDASRDFASVLGTILQHEEHHCAISSRSKGPEGSGGGLPREANGRDREQRPTAPDQINEGGAK